MLHRSLLLFLEFVQELDKVLITCCCQCPKMWYIILNPLILLSRLPDIQVVCQ